MTADARDATPPSVPSVLGVRSVVKRYGPVLALAGVDFDAYAGEVTGLVGDNGAGKSTLIKILVGVVRPDEGYVTVNGDRHAWQSAAQPRAVGIETVFQDLALCDPLSVVANFFLGRETVGRAKRLTPLNKRRMRSEAREAIEGFGLDLQSMDARVRTLSGGERQGVAIARAVHFGARALLLDEPTNALSVKETEKVLDAIREAVRRKIAVIMISHTLGHVNDLADRIYVLDRGRLLMRAGRGELSVLDLENIVAGRESRAPTEPS